MNYKLMGNLLEQSGSKVWGCSPKAISNFFVAMDVLCVVLQVVAGVAATISVAMSIPLLTKVSHAVLLASFLLQIALNGLFTALLSWAYKQALFHPSSSPLPNMRQVWQTMCITVGLLWARNLYRAGEGFAMVAGTESGMAIEGLFYAFEAVPVLLCCVLFCIWHHGILLPVTDQELSALLGDSSGLSREGDDGEIAGAAKIALGPQDGKPGLPDQFV